VAGAIDELYDQAVMAGAMDHNQNQLATRTPITFLHLFVTQRVASSSWWVTHKEASKQYMTNTHSQLVAHWAHHGIRGDSTEV